MAGGAHATCQKKTRLLKMQLRQATTAAAVQQQRPRQLRKELLLAAPAITAAAKKTAKKKPKQIAMQSNCNFINFERNRFAGALAIN